jgi:CheY-like chemotaxis protein
LAKLASHGTTVDLLLTDVVMPQMSGPDLAAAARRHSPQIRILFMSGYSGDSLLDRIAELGEASVVEKPFRPAELVAKVRKVMGEAP